jgi:uncharacterized protein YabN with tetrapyrrole methylase and pyrophosphatase domain
VSASQERVGLALARLNEITRRLRRECPWDREQDERSIVPHTIEEAYELADAARSGDAAKMLDELGDVLFQVYFLALLLEERGSGDLERVANAVTEKLIRRHPHVFADEATKAATEVLNERPADSSAAVLGNWDQIKREVEGRGAEDPFADVPENLPGLLYARKLLRRAASAERLTGPAGAESAPELPAQDHRSALEQARQALEALEVVPPPAADANAAANSARRDQVERALGEALLALVDAARLFQVDPELALRATADGLRGGASKS